MQGYRLLALAGGVVHGVEQLHLGSMTLPQLEARTQHPLGLIVLTDHLRHDSKDTVQHLQDRLVLIGLKGSTKFGSCPVRLACNSLDLVGAESVAACSLNNFCKVRSGLSCCM